MSVGDTLKVDIASVPDREELVGEVLCSRGYICQVFVEKDGKAVLKLYPCYDADFWTLDYEEFLAALVKAREGATNPVDSQNLPGS